MSDKTRMARAEMIKRFKETADLHTSKGRDAWRAFAAALTKPILQKLEQVSYMRDLFEVENLEPGAQASYPIADDYESPVWILPGMAYVAQDYMEFVQEEVVIQTFTVQAAKDWKIAYAKEGRIDIVTKAQNYVAKTLAKFEEEAGWRVLAPACTKAFDGAGVTAPRPAPIYQMPQGDATAGYFSKELINRMMVGMQRIGRNLDELWVSPEDIADIREYTETDVDPYTRREIFQAKGLGKIWDVNLRTVDALGVRGLWNIHDKDSDFGPFKGDSVFNRFNDYTITNGNLVDINGNLLQAGETQVYGFDRSDVALVMPVKEEFQAFEDPNLLRRQKQGFFGWQTFGMACIDSRFICMGIIDRYTPQS
jgi:hypothetical protein